MVEFRRCRRANSLLYIALLMLNLAPLMVGCAGNGVLYQKITKKLSEEESTLFIGREEQIAGKIMTIDVSLNERPIATLGAGEIVTRILGKREYTVEARPVKPASLIYSARSLSFESLGNKNRFVVIRINDAIPGFGGQVELKEVNAEAFRTATNLSK